MAQPPDPTAVRMRLLGTFRVFVGSRTVEESGWRLKKAAGLVGRALLGIGTGGSGAGSQARGGFDVVLALEGPSR
jgi:hypothetical protein